MDSILFTETQKFDQIWIRAIVLLLTIFLFIVFGTAIYEQIFRGIPVGSKPAPDAVLVILALFFFLLSITLCWLFFSLRLILEVRKNKICYRFPPLINRTRIINTSEISGYAIRKYKPIAEFGGWGIRWGWSGKGDAFNVRGNIGLQLQLKNGKKILFGTQRPEALLASIKKIMQSA